MLDDDAAKTLLQPTFFATNQRAQDGYTNKYTHTHLASLACVVSCLRLVASLCRLAARCSGVCCRRLAASLCRFARSLCVCVCLFFGGGIVLSVVSKCVHCGRMCWCHVLSYYSRNRRAQPVGIVPSCVCSSRTRCCALRFGDDNGRALFFV